MVVYDQSTRDASVLAADSFLSLLLSKLDGCFDSVAILTGELGRPRQDALSSLPTWLEWGVKEVSVCWGSGEASAPLGLGPSLQDLRDLGLPPWPGGRSRQGHPGAGSC